MNVWRKLTGFRKKQCIRKNRFDEFADIWYDDTGAAVFLRGD